MHITFPEFTGTRCLMMPYIQGNPLSVPQQYRKYADILSTVFIKKGDIGYLTIDESSAYEGTPHRGKRAKFGRALHTEAGKQPSGVYTWGDGGLEINTTLDPNTQVLLANSLEHSCAIWDVEHGDTSRDGDIGEEAATYPYDAAHLLSAGEVRTIGILTPHESLPVPTTGPRQFLRIISSGVHGREPYFTKNPLLAGGN